MGGVIHTKEHNIKISESHKGKHLSDKTKDKISEGLNNMSDEEKQNLYKKRSERISEALKGKHKPLFKYQTPSGEIKIMSNQHAQRHHKDWILIGLVE